MAMLFYIDEQKNLVLRPECAKLSPELAVLDEKELLLIILVYDYHSIYRQFPEADRRRRAMIHVYGESVMEVFDKQIIKDAIFAYTSLQYDRRVELIIKYQREVDKMVELLELDETTTGKKKSMEAIDLFTKKIEELENRHLESIKQKGQIKGNQEMSWIEDIMSNQKYFKSVIDKK